MILRSLRRNIYDASQRMGGLQRRDDALKLAAKLKRRHSLVVGRREESHPAQVVEPGMFRADAGIVEAGGDRMGLLDLSVVVHQQVRAIAVEPARPAARNGGRMLAALKAKPGGLDAVDLDRAVVEERIEQPHGVGAAADAGDQGI